MGVLGGSEARGARDRRGRITLCRSFCGTGLSPAVASMASSIVIILYSHKALGYFTSALRGAPKCSS